MKEFRVQLHRYEEIPLSDAERLPRVNYQELLDQLKFPVIWVYEHYLQAWLPSEVDHAMLKDIGFKRAIPQVLEYANLVEPVRIYWERLQESYARDGYVIIPSLIAENYAKQQLAPYYRRQHQHHQRHRDMEGIFRSSINNLAWMRLLHQASEKLINYIVQPQAIKTSYSFASQYDFGSSLPKHTDRPQCIYNVSLMLGSSPYGADLTKWPLFLEREGKIISAALKPGDGVLYLGTRDPHWRDPMPKDLETVLGVFFHYVDSQFTGSLD